MEINTRLIVTGRKRLKSTQIFIIATIILLTLFTTLLCIGFLVRYEVSTDVSDIASISYWNDKLPKEQQVWYQKGIDELKIALNKNLNKKQARNVLIFVANGISPEALAAVRFWNAEAGQAAVAKLMSWEKFPHVGRLKNSCSNLDVCDPFTISTALFGGVKTNFRIGGLDAAVNFRNCTAAANATHHVKSIFRQAQEIGLRTGLITTKRVTGPTVAALYAHTPATSWECDALIPLGPLTQSCQDTAQQLIESETGSHINVIMGGGRQTLISNVPITKWDPIDETVCNSQDRRNLIRDWRRQKLRRNQTFAVLQNNDELIRLNGSNVDYALGIYTNGDLKPIISPHKTEDHTPKLQDMINKSIDILERKKNGFLLLTEVGVKSGSGIVEQVKELVNLNTVIERILELKRPSTADTLMLVLFTKGSFVRNVLDSSAENPDASDFHDVINNDDLFQQRLSNLVTETMIYARGPKSHLFHGIHDETYMAYVISYALQMGYFNTNLKEANEQVKFTVKKSFSEN